MLPVLRRFAVTLMALASVASGSQSLAADDQNAAADSAVTSAALPADWAVQRLIAEVAQSRGRGETYSVDFDAYAQDASRLRGLPIGVFDSGIGGLTVLQALLTSDLHDNASGRPGVDGRPDFADERFLYLGDQANMPYGNYSAVGKEDLLREFILRDALFLLGRREWPAVDATEPRLTKPPVKAIVIACNTATAYGLEDLRQALERWGLPVIVVGVVEAGANSAVDLLPREGEADAIAILATTGTCSSGAYPRAIARVAGQRGRRQPLVLQQGSVSLAGVIERDPAFVGAADGAAVVEYRGPAVANPQAAIDPSLASRYGFDPAGLQGNPADASTWRLTSTDNYIRYDVTTLVEVHRRSGSPRPIRYVMLGCTHFPFEADRIRAAFTRLRDSTAEDGTQPYRELIAEQIELIDPAALTAKELYRSLFLAQRLAIAATPVAGAANDADPHAAAEVMDGRGHRLFVSVPAPSTPAGVLTTEGWFTHDYKYGRTAGLTSGRDTRIIPLAAERMPAAIRDLIRSRCPEVWRVIENSHATP